MNPRSATRREFLKAASFVTGGLSLGADRTFASGNLFTLQSSAAEQLQAALTTDFSSWSAAFSAPCSPFFGVKMESRSESFGNGMSGERPKRVARDPETYYMAGGISGEEEPHSFFLSFEISNQQILCSATSTGGLRNPLVYSKLVPTHRRGRSFESPQLLGGSAWSFGVQRRGGDPHRLPTTHGSTVKLLDALYPIFEHECEGLHFATLAFAPESGGSIAGNPRAIVVAIAVTNPGRQTWQDVLLAPPLESAASPATERWIASPAESPHPRFTENPVPIAPGFEAIVCLEGTQWARQAPAVAMEIPAGETRTFTFALLLDSSAERVKQTAALMAQRSALEWFSLTRQANARRYGALSIENGEYFAELPLRMVEEDRSAVLMSDTNDIFDGGPSGATFSLAYFQPEIPSRTITALKDFQKRSAGVKPYADVSYSLVNSLGALPWAGLYYRMSGDAECFTQTPAFLDYAEETLADIEATRAGDVWLFPSKMLWDGPTPGDYNTGANVLAWLGFASAARLAAEVYRRDDLAGHWGQVADNIHADFYKHCIGPGPLGPTFYQGGNRDGSFVHGHDGEEAFTTMAAFFGFCEADEPALMRYAKLAFTRDNPLYAPEVDGIWWDAKVFGSGTTMPGQMAKLIAGADEREIAANLAGLRKIVDLDGSFWWWPYLYPCTDPRMVGRRGQPADTSKCGYAAAVYTAVFITNILGIFSDVPARSIQFRPFTPWKSFRWRQCRLGPVVFDFEQEQESGMLSAAVLNQNSFEYKVTLELTLPTPYKSARARTNGLSSVVLSNTARFGRPAVRVAGTVVPSGRAELALEMH
jgi:hypothetical protein